MTTATTPTDPLFPTQWGLSNTGQQGGHIGTDINLLPLGGQFTGKGVRVDVIDDGTQLDQPDLVGTIDRASSFDSVLATAGNGSGGPTSPKQNHGTAVAGIIGANANTIGSVGVAPGATLVITRIPLGDDPLYTGEGSLDSIPTEDGATTNAFRQALAAKVDVANNSWGTPAPFDNPAYLADLQTLATQGRGGKGIDVVLSNGNDRTTGSNGGISAFKSSRFLIAVGAMDNNGVTSSYSTPGANLLVTAPAGASTDQLPTVPGTAITTTDRTGMDGYNTQASPSGDSTYDFNGTSASAPFVSGVIALMLQANPNLGYRDVQQILAMTARKTDPSAAGWTTNAATLLNGGGLHFNSDYGFGLVDAHAAVRLAQSYAMMSLPTQSEANVRTVTGATTATAPIAIGKGTTTTITLGTGLVEHVTLTLALTVADAARVSVTLTSPAGTAIVLSPFVGNAAGIAWPGAFPLGTDAFWGEQAQGNWTVTVDTLKGEANPGSITGASLAATGPAPAAGKDVVLTDEFAAMAAARPARAVIDAGSAPGNTFNAAATSGTNLIDLKARTGSLGGAAFTLAATSTIDEVIGGDGLNVIFGDAANHSFVTGHGQSFVGLGDGSDSVISQGQDTILGGAGNSVVFGLGASVYAIGGAGALTFSGLQGSDTVFAGGGGGVLFGGTAGNSLLVGGAGLACSTVVGGGSGDILWAEGPASATLVAGAGNETLSGGSSSGSDTFIAGPGADVIGGGTGNDTVFAGSGAMTVDGGAGRDLFVFARANGGGSALINDFNPAERVTLTGYAPGELASALGRATTAGGSSTITLSDNTRITFAGITTLNAAMFV